MREALLAGAWRTPGLAGQAAAGELDVGAAMQRIAPSGYRTATRALAPHVRLRMRGPRIRADRLTLRWTVGGDRGAVAGYRLEVTGRPPVGHGTRRLTGRATSWTLRMNAGGWRWRLVALDARGRPLAQLSGRTRSARHR